MTDIILSTRNCEPVASSRQIAESFGKEHRNVMRDIENLMTAGVLKNEQTPMFYKTEYTHEQNGQTYPMYLMNRDGFTLLAMGFTGKAALEWKLKYIQAFNAMEKQLAQRPQLSRAELMAQALIAAHDELEHKDRQIAELTPKGIFADAVNASKKSILVGELAKLLCQNSVQIGQNRLFVWMREHGYLIRDPKRSDYNMPTQRAVEQGLFEIKETTVVHSDGHTSIKEKRLKKYDEGRTGYLPADSVLEAAWTVPQLRLPRSGSRQVYRHWPGHHERQDAGAQSVDKRRDHSNV